jgi:hypothetical protein
MAQSFIKALVVAREERNIRIFDALDCKDGKKLSVQASQSHYCEPKATLPVDRLEEYTEWELAMIDGDNWFIPQPEDPVYGKFAYWWIGDDVVGHVPTEKVQELYEAACL